MSNYELVASDAGSKLIVRCRDNETKDTIDLTGKTVQLRYALNGGATVQKTMTVLNQSANPGKAEYQFLTTDVTVGGALAGEVRLQAGLADQITAVDTFHISIKTPLP